MNLLTYLQQEMWSPYVVGAGIGIISWLSFLLSGRGLGASSSYLHVSGMAEKAVRGEKVMNREYLQQHPPKLGWQVVLIFVGVVLGSFISSALSGSFNAGFIPPLWEKTFGSALAPRLLTALAGGFFIGFGARWAGGCTSGHGLTGTMQLFIGSWLAAVSFFIGGVVTALVMYNFFGA